MKLLILDVMAIIGVSCVISLGAFQFEPVLVLIEVTADKGNMPKIYKDLQVQLSLRELQEVSTVDTTGNRVTLVLFIENDLRSACCEELLRAMARNRDYSRIDYCIID